MLQSPPLSLIFIFLINLNVYSVFSVGIRCLRFSAVARSCWQGLESCVDTQENRIDVLM